MDNPLFLNKVRIFGSQDLAIDENLENIQITHNRIRLQPQLSLFVFLCGDGSAGSGGCRHDFSLSISILEVETHGSSRLTGRHRHSLWLDMAFAGRLVLRGDVHGALRLNLGGSE